MSIILRRFFILVLSYFPLSLSAQEPYTVSLNSGKFIPGENIGKIDKSSETFVKSLHEDVYYLALQFRQLPSDNEKAKLASAGIRLIDYIPNNVYTVAVNRNASLDVLSAVNARSIFRLTTEQKTMPALLAGNYPGYAIKQTGWVDVTLITYEKLPGTSLSAIFASLNATVLEELPVFRSFTLRVPEENLKKLVEQSFAQWVEFIDPPKEKTNLLGRTLHRVNVLNDGPRNLKGDGINIGIWDGDVVSPHLDFSPMTRLHIMELNGSPASHATHCAGTIAGKGLINPKARGMAPNAAIYSYDFYGNIEAEMATVIPALGLSVSSHSYGSLTQTCGLNGVGVRYSAAARANDINLNTFKDHLHVQAAGNYQGNCTGGWSTISAGASSSKNNILVANITSDEVLSGSSSCGPVQDGRVKPEISSFGTNVFSAYTPLNTYAYNTGTSMATPGVAGSVALLVQRYKQLNGNNVPLSSLIKNTICNTAADLGNTGPDYRFGYGRLNTLEAVRILEQNRYAINTIGTGAANDFTINVPAGATRLRVMLTWNDPAATANANPALVNNLNLSLINGAATSLPWILDPNNPGTPATTGVDNVSNIEQVTLNSPAAGTYTVRVAGASVPAGPQEYVVTWFVEEPYIELIYPNGNESFEPGVNETITWNNAGVTGTQTVEYSLDNGANWTSIASNVAANTTRLDWTPPAANTSTALIRVTAGALTDVSDATFKILGVVSNLNTTNTCTIGAVAFTWAAVTNATHYDLLELDETTGNWDVIGTNITGTSYTASGLTPNASLWFTIIAKNNTTGASGERALAINRTASATGLPAIGNISGQSGICGAATNIIYSVPVVTGATGYTWTVPAGATIAGGQGTNTITVNYTAGTAGNITVFASAGACQTSNATLAVISGSSVTAPLSGGDQSQVVCAPAPVPLLTATANVAAGHTVVWYSSATGPGTVANPILNSVGTVTYYAASRNTASGCESLLRTGVTLTISNPVPVSITTNGPVAFCQGGSVVLTASAGDAYQWSNGATTQSITANTAGSYTVSVTQSGCTIQSPVTTVTVNALPVATVSANGPIAFCQGNSVMLTASAGASYLWSTGATTQSITVGSSGSYTVKVTNANNCSNTSAATVVTVTPQPQVTISATPFTRLYPGLTTTLSATINPAGTYTYNWFKNSIALPGANNSSLPVTIDKLGTYSLIVTNTGGCSNVSNLVAIGDSASNRLFIYPSPNRGQFQVSYYATASTQAYQLVIYDAKGSKVYHNSYVVLGGYDRMPVDLRRNGKGAYRVVVFDKNGKSLATGSVVVQ